MIRYIRNTLILCLTAILAACQSTTEPKEDVVSATVRFLAPSACARLDSPAGTVVLGTVEFENTSTVASIVPKQLAAQLSTTSIAAVKMFHFGPEWRNTDNSITANVDAQTDPVGSYIQFGTLTPIPPGGKFQTVLKGNIPNATAGTYTFAIMSDSVKVKTVAGDNVVVTMGANNFALATKTNCP